MKFWDLFGSNQGLSDDLIDQKFYLVENMMLELSGNRRRLFACDCVERALPIFESRFPDDDRPRNAIMVARRHAFGIASREELAAAHADVLRACDVALSTAPKKYQNGEEATWPPLAVVQAAALSAVEDIVELNPVPVSRYIIRAVERVAGNVFKEKQWQYKQVKWYLNK